MRRLGVGDDGRGDVSCRYLQLINQDHRMGLDFWAVWSECAFNGKGIDMSYFTRMTKGEDQARDDHGRFASGSGGAVDAYLKQRAARPKATGQGELF